MEGEWPNCKIYVHEATFQNLRLNVKYGCCRIRVTEGTKGDAYEAERMESLVKDGTAQDFVQKQLEEGAEAASQRWGKALTGYTYVALWFDRVSFRMIFPGGVYMLSTRWAHHITLAYLPWMDYAERASLQKSLNELFHEWTTTASSSRPTSLLTSRSILIGRRARDLPEDFLRMALDKWPGSDVYTFMRSDFFNEPWDRLSDLIDDGLL